MFLFCQSMASIFFFARALICSDVSLFNCDIMLLEDLLGVIESLGFFLVLLALLGCSWFFQLLTLLALLERDMSSSLSSLSSLSLSNSFKVSMFLGNACGLPSESELFVLFNKPSLSDKIPKSSDNGFGFAHALSDIMGSKSK